MPRGNRNKSDELLCCGARLWSLVIGWLQTIASVITLVFYVASCISFTSKTSDPYSDSSPSQASPINSSNSSNSTDEDQSQPPILVSADLYMLIITGIVGLVAGIILIVGVKQESVRKLQVWAVLQVISLIFTFGSFVVGMVGVGYGLLSAIRDMFVISLKIYCLMVVSVHKRELILLHISEKIKEQKQRLLVIKEEDRV